MSPQIEDEIGPLDSFKDGCEDLVISVKTGGRWLETKPEFRDTVLKINGRRFSIRKRREDFKRTLIARSRAGGAA
jgi:hypothetical protein